MIREHPCLIPMPLFQMTNESHSTWAELDEEEKIRIEITFNNGPAVILFSQKEETFQFFSCFTLYLVICKHRINSTDDKRFYLSKGIECLLCVRSKDETNCNRIKHMCVWISGISELSSNTPRVMFVSICSTFPFSSRQIVLLQWQNRIQ